MPKAMSSEARSAFLSNFGTSAKDDYETDETAGAAAEESTEQAEGAEEPEAAVEETAEEEQETAAEGGEEDEEGEAEAAVPDHAELLRRATEKLSRPEVSAEAPQSQGEVDRLRQRVQELEGALGQRISEVEGRLKAPPVGEKKGFDFTSPEVISLFQDELGVDEEHAKKAARVYSTMSKLIVEQELGGKLKDLETRAEQDKQTRVQQERELKRRNNLITGLQHVMARGGLEGEIAKQAYQLGETSLLAQHLRKFPSKADSPEGIVDAVISVARGVQLMAEDEGQSGSNGNPAKVSGSKQEVTAALESRSKRNVRKPKEATTPEDEILQGILDAQPAIRKLPKGFYG